jgi:uncharacterized protein YjbI with pentapeptide repeats
MARLTQAEVLRRYQAGERDFRGADLRSLRFRGQTLAGADFSSADLRGTDFLDADLRGAQFVGACCGLTRMRWLGQAMLGLGIGMVIGFLLFTMTILFFHVFLPAAPRASAGRLLFIAATGLTILICLGGFSWEGFNSKGSLFLFALPVAFFVATTIAVAIGGSVAESVAGAVAVAVAVGVAGAVAVGVASAGAGAVGVGLAVAFGVASAGAVPVGLLFLFITIIAWWRTRQGASGYAGCRSFGIAIGALGATRFCGADLRGAYFTNANLTRSNFMASRRQATRLERVCWKGARGLELARTGGTILADPRCRQLLLSGSAPGANLQGLNLRGAFLPQVDLRSADLRESNLSEAVLTEAHLEGANLKASQCLGTDLSGAHVTGATLEGWNIDHATQLTGVDCAYVYLLEPFDALGQRRDDHHRERLPHDPDKIFGPGDFETYFKQLIEEVKLLIKNGIDAKAFQQAFQEVMRQHPEITPQSVTGIKRNGDDVLVTLQPSAPVDKGAVEQTFFDEYNALKLDNVRLQALLEGERQRSEDRGNHAAQLAELAGRLIPPANPTSTTVTIAPVINPVIGGNNAESQATTMNNTSIHTGNGSFVNTGSLNTAGDLVHGDKVGRDQISDAAAAKISRPLRPGPWRVFLSHTSELRQYPSGGSYIDRVERAVSAAGHAIVDMADFPAIDETPAAVCEERVRGCDVLVGIYGLKYGSPVRDRPEASYSELEFLAATEVGIPRLIFIVNTESEDLRLPTSALVDRSYGDRQTAFVKRVKDSGLTVQFFRNPEDLKGLVERSLRELADSAKAPS